MTTNAQDKVLDAVHSICDHLVERAATLFLGAGASAGVTDGRGTRCPLGSELAEWICRDLLNSPQTKAPLDEAVEMAGYKLGLKTVNDYVYECLKGFNPGAAHLALVQLPWDAIYTTNFDLLVEKAATSGAIQPAGQIRPILTSMTPLVTFTESDILYYKLHGSIDYANTSDGRLILTKSDYRFYEDFKRPLFRRLGTDLLSRNFVFVGYSLSDSNFRAVLDDCRDELGVQTFPLSYAIQRDFTDVQEAFWREKYNIQLIKADATEFLVTLKDTWFNEKCEVVPFLQRKAVEYLNFDTSTRFQRIGDSFYLMRASDCTGPSKPSVFFRGAEPSWADVRDQVAPRRDMYDSLLEAVFPEIAEPDMGPSALLILGSAGTGKTTLLRTLCYEFSQGFGTPVFIHIAGTPLDSRVLTPLINPKHPQRFIVLVDFAAEYARELNLFWEEIKHKRLPITLLLEERKNQWLVAKTSTPMQLNPTEFELGSLSAGEINKILDALDKYGSLEKLSGMSRDEQTVHFTSLAHQDLLVALRELTTNTRFDNIVQNEFEKIPSPAAKRAYLHVSAVGQFDLAVRYETLVRLLHLRYDQLVPDILMPTEGILMTGEETGGSRHNLGFRLRARHPIIASIVFGTAAPDDATKFEVLNGLLSNLDPAFPEDLRLLNEITRKRELVNTFAEHAMRRALYDRIAAILPNNGYVYQHRSIVERDMGDAGEAVRFARLALKIDPKHSHFQNTLGLALELAARAETGMKRQQLLAEADRLFDEGIKRDRANPYAYIGKLNIIKQNIEHATGKDEKDELTVSALALLEDAYEATAESSMIAGELGKIKEQLGSLDKALDVLRRADKKNPGDMRLKQLLIRFSVEKGEAQEALKVARDAARLDPTSWRIQRLIAQLLSAQGGNLNSVRGHYEAAIRHHKGDINLVVELASYLFMQGDYQEANKVFETIRDLSVSPQDRNRVREIWRDKNGNPLIFEGKILRIAGAKGVVIAIPDNFEVYYWRSTGTSLLREGNDVEFSVGFTSQGATARNLKLVR